MTNLLTSPQRLRMQNLALSEIPVPLRRRALLLLLYDEGRTTKEVADSVGLSRSAARGWRRRFREKGDTIFPPETLDGSQPPVDLPELPPPPLEIEEPVPAEPVAPAQPAAPVEIDTPPAVEKYPAATKLPSPGVQPEDSLAEAGRKIWLYNFGQMLLNEQGTRLGADIEALHDMRVATRRMRAAFEVYGDAFAPKVLKAHLKGLRAAGRALGSVRDLDVFLEKAHLYRTSLPEADQEGLQPLLDAWQQQRQAARAKMLDYLDGKTYAAFTQKFYRFLTASDDVAPPVSDGLPVATRVCEVTPKLIYTRLAAVRAYDSILENASIEQFHALRIEFKKLRYSVEFFREVLGSEAKFVITEIKILQDHLGDLNDAQVATTILRDFLTDWDAGQAHLPVAQRKSPEPVIVYLTYQYSQRQNLMLTFREAWERFNQPVFRQSLAAAVAVL